MQRRPYREHGQAAREIDARGAQAGRVGTWTPIGEVVDIVIDDILAKGQARQPRKDEDDRG